MMGFCVFCGGSTESRDHVPSKVFLDSPYPANLPVVPACDPCNGGFSRDEQYVACLIACAQAGATEPDAVKRLKIRRILRQTPWLASRLADARQVESGSTVFSVETERVQNVVLKLARGHAAFELNEPRLDAPSHIAFSPFTAIDDKIRVEFESPPISSVFPEVGSRAMQQLVVTRPGASRWLTVQPDRYRYMTSVADGVNVRGAISEYLAFEVRWP